VVFGWGCWGGGACFFTLGGFLFFGLGGWVGSVWCVVLFGGAGLFGRWVFVWVSVFCVGWGVVCGGGSSGFGFFVGVFFSWVLPPLGIGFFFFCWFFGGGFRGCLRLWGFLGGGAFSGWFFSLGGVGVFFVFLGGGVFLVWFFFFFFFVGVLGWVVWWVLLWVFSFFLWGFFFWGLGFGEGIGPNLAALGAPFPSWRSD